MCMGISLYFVLAESFSARILSDGLPTASGDRSVSDLTPEKILEQKVEVFIGKKFREWDRELPFPPIFKVLGLFSALFVVVRVYKFKFAIKTDVDESASS